MEENDGGVSSVFSFLPEGCIASIIAWTSPKDASRASAISSDFKSASDADTVWEGFLPADYREIISKSVNSPVEYATKKELFFKLCHSPLLINDGKLSFWLSKSSGKKCYMLCARELSIVWQETPTYWGWTSIRESRFSEVAVLRAVCWLDMQAKVQTQMLSLKTTYAAYLVYKVAEDSYGLEVIARASVRFTEAASSVGNTMSTGIGADTNATINLVEPESISIYLSQAVHRLRYVRSSGWHRRQYLTNVQMIDGQVPQRRPDGWMEIFLGEFFNDEGEGEIEIKLLENKILNWKRGLILEGIELRPKEDR